MDVVDCIHACVPCDVESTHHQREQQADGYQQRNGGEICPMFAAQVVIHQVAGTPQQVPDGEEHIAVAYAPKVHHVEGHSLPCEPFASVLQTALGAIVTIVLLVAVGTDVLFVTLLDGGLVVLLLPFQT